MSKNRKSLDELKEGFGGGKGGSLGGDSPLKFYASKVNYSLLDSRALLTFSWNASTH